MRRGPRIDRLIKDTLKRLEATNPTALSEAPDSHVAVILEKAGFQRMTSSVLKQIEDALRDAGISCYPSLLDPKVDRDTRIFFFLDGGSPVLPSGGLFSTEAELERFVVENFGVLRELDGLRLRKRQFRINNECIIDLLCDDIPKKQLVGIELKHRAPNEGAASQVRRYLDALCKRAEHEGKAGGARLILVTGIPDERVARDIEALLQQDGLMDRFTWLTYRAALELAVAPRWKASTNGTGDPQIEDADLLSGPIGA